MSRIFSAVFSVFVIFLCAQALAQPAVNTQAKGVMEYRMEANQAYLAKDYPAFLAAVKQLLALRPNNSDYMIQQVIAAALNDDKPLAYGTMLRMQQQGMAYDFTATDDTLSIRGTEVFDYVNGLLAGADQPLGAAKTLFEIPGSVMLPTALVRDDSRDAWLLGTAREGLVLEVKADGSSRELLRANEENGLWGITGLLVDQAQNRLWISSASTSSFVGSSKADVGHSAVYEFSLDELELLRKYPLPDDQRPHKLGDLVLSPAGDLYVIDQAFPVLYALPKGGHELVPFLASSDLVSLRGMTMNVVGSRLYVADYEMGVMVVDLVNKTVSLLQLPANLNLFGIEAVSFWNDHLVTIQGGYKPQRIMRLALDEAGTGVSDVAPVVVALEQFDHPAIASLHGDQLTFLANIQRLVPGTRELGPVTVATTNIKEPVNFEAPDPSQLMRGKKAVPQAEPEG